MILSDILNRSYEDKVFYVLYRTYNTFPESVIEVVVKNRKNVVITPYEKTYLDTFSSYYNYVLLSTSTNEVIFFTKSNEPIFISKNECILFYKEQIINDIKQNFEIIKELTTELHKIELQQYKDII